MPAWVRSAGLDAESFRAHFFPHASARASERLQAVAAAIGWTDDLGPAMTALAEAVQVVGLDNAPRFLAAAAEQAANANAAAAPLPIIKAQAPPSEGEPSDEERPGPEGEPLNYNEQLRLNEYNNAYKELKTIDPPNPALGPFLQTPNWVPSEADAANIKAALAAAKRRSNQTSSPGGPEGPNGQPAGSTQQTQKLSPSEQLNVASLVGQGWTQAEATIIARSQTVLQSPEFQILRNAHATGLPAEVEVSGVSIIYEPSLPPGYSGTTLFGGKGFVIGPGAFASETEVSATVLQEMYRLGTSVIGSTRRAVVGQAGGETLTAQTWANRAVGALQPR